MQFSFKDLISPVTRAEAQASIYAVMTTVGLKVTAWEAGAVTRTIVTANALMFSALSQLQADIARSGFLDYARGAWLRLVAYHVYNVEAIVATFATGECKLTNTGGGLYELDAGDCIVRNAATGKAYRNVEAFVLESNATLTVEFIALEAGSNSNANVGAITEFVTTLSRVAVTNDAPFIAIDDESEAALRTRCREKLGALSPFGPWDAYSYAARTAKTSVGAPAGATRVAVGKDGFGHVFVTVATASGSLVGDEGDLTTPLGAVDEAIQQLAAPLAITATVQSAAPINIPIVYHAWVYDSAGYTDEAIKERIAEALLESSARQPIGGARLDSEDVNGYVFADAVRATIANALPEDILHVTVTLLDTEIEPLEVPIFLHNPDTQATITQIARPEGLV